MNPRAHSTVLTFAGFIACVVVANYMTERWGFVSLLGLSFTAGTYAAGLSFGVRDALQEAGGRRLVIVAILTGGAVSYLVAPALAVASCVAFLLSESLDLAVYTPLRERRWVVAVVASNLAGATVDTVVFLALAFGWHSLTTQAVAGQMFAKALMVLPALAIVAWARRSAVKP